MRTSEIGAIAIDAESNRYGPKLNAATNRYLNRLQDIIIATTPAAEKLAARLMKEMEGKGFSDELLQTKIFEIVSDYVIKTVDGSGLIRATIEEASSRSNDRVGDLSAGLKRAVETYGNVTKAEQSKVEGVIKHGLPEGMPINPAGAAHPYTSLATAADNYSGFVIGRYSGPAGVMGVDSLGAFGHNGDRSPLLVKEVLDSFGIRVVNNGDELSTLLSVPYVTGALLEKLQKGTLNAEGLPMDIEANRQSVLASVRLVKHAYGTLAAINHFNKRGSSGYVFQSILEGLDDNLVRLQEGEQTIKPEMLGVGEGTAWTASEVRSIVNEVADRNQQALLFQSATNNDSILKAKAYIHLALDVADRNMRPGELQSPVSGITYRNYLSGLYMESAGTNYTTINVRGSHPVDMVGLVSGYVDAPVVEGQKPTMVVTGMMEPAIPPSRTSLIFSDIANASTQKDNQAKKLAMVPNHIRSMAISYNLFNKADAVPSNWDRGLISQLHRSLSDPHNPQANYFITRMPESTLSINAGEMFAQIAGLFGSEATTDNLIGRKLVMAMTGDSAIHMAEQIGTTSYGSAYGINSRSAYELAELFGQADTMMKDAVSRAQLPTRSPLHMLIGAKGHLTQEAFNVLASMPGYKEALYKSVLSAASVMMLPHLMDARRPYLSALSLTTTSRRGMELTPERLLELHRFVTGKDTENAASVMESIQGDWRFTRDRNNAVVLSSSSALRESVEATVSYLGTAEGMTRFADLCGAFMAEHFIIPKVGEHAGLTRHARQGLIDAIRMGSYEAPHSAVHPYVDLGLPGQSPRMDSIVAMHLASAENGNPYSGSYASGEAKAGVLKIKNVLRNIIEMEVAPYILSSNAIEVLASREGLKADLNINRAQDGMLLSREDRTAYRAKLVDAPPQAYFSGMYEDYQYLDTGTSQLLPFALQSEQVLNPVIGGNELIGIAGNTVGWRQGRPIKGTDSVGRTRSIVPGSTTSRMDVIPAEDGGMLAALMSIDSSPMSYDTDFIAQPSQITVETPHPTVTESVIREGMYRSIVDRATKVGSDTIDIAPPSETLSRVGPDVMQVIESTMGTKDVDARALFANRGIRAAAIGSVAFYDSNVAQFGLSQRGYGFSDAIPSHEPSLMQGQGKGPQMMSDSKHRKGYSWTRLQDGSIMVNVSGDHLGYKTGAEKGHVSWGFSLMDGVGYDPISKTVAPASYLIQSAVADIMSAAGHDSRHLDPHSKEFLSQYMKSVAARVGAPMSGSRQSMMRGYIDGSIAHSPDLSIPHVFATGRIGELGDAQNATTRYDGRYSKLDRDKLREGMRARSYNPFEGEGAFPFGEFFPAADDFTASGMAAASISGQMQPGNYVSIVIPKGATKDQIARMILDVHVDSMHNAALHAAGVIRPRGGLGWNVFGHWGNKQSPGKASGRKYQYAINGSGRSLSKNLWTVTDPAGREANIRYALERDPKLMEDIDVLAGRIMGQESSYFLPDTERTFASTGDTGAAIATLFPGRPDMLDYSWDAKNANGIKVWKRTIPKGVDPAKYASFVVQTDQPVGMSIEGAIQLGQKAIAFKTEAEATAFANRLSAMSSRAAIVKAFGGDFEIVDRRLRTSQRGSLLPEAIKPSAVSLDPVVMQREMALNHGENINFASEVHELALGEAIGASSIGDAVVPYAANSKQATALAASINSRKHVRLVNPGISVNHMISGTHELEALVRQKGNFGIPGGAIQYASKAMHAICHGKMYSNGNWKDFAGLTGIQWYKHLTSCGVSKDEIRQMGLGVLFHNNKDILLTRKDVAEYFAHFYPTVVRQDLQLTNAFYRMNQAWLGAVQNANVASGAYGIHLPYPLSSQNVTRANQLSALKGLADRYNSIKGMLDNPGESTYGFSPEHLSRMADIRSGFEALAQLTATNHGLGEIKFSKDFTPADLFMQAHARVLELSAKGIAGSMGLGAEKQKVGSAVLLDLRKAAGMNMSVSEFEDFRLTFNAHAQALRDTLAGSEAVRLAFKDIEPFIRYGVSDESTLIADNARRNNSLLPSVDPQFTHNFAWPGSSVSSKELGALSSYFTSGQVINFEEYGGHSNYYSGPLHQTSHGVVRFATPEQIAEMDAYIGELTDRLKATPEGPDRARIQSIISSANSAKSARVIQMNKEFDPGQRHFGGYMQGNIYGMGQYEIGHIRQSHGILTSVIPLNDLSGSNILGAMGRERAQGNMDLVSMPMSIIEEIQSDLFQGDNVIGEYVNAQGGMSALTTDPASLAIGPRVAELAKLKDQANQLRVLANNADDAVRVEMLTQIMPARELGNINGDRITATGSTVTSNVLRHSLISNFDLLSRIANAPLIGPFMRPTGRTIAVPESLKAQLQQLSRTTLPERLAVFEYDSELVGQVQRAAALLGVGDAHRIPIVDNTGPIPGLEKLAARVLANMDTISEESRRAGWTSVADAADQMFKELRKEITQNPDRPGWVKRYMESYEKVYHTYSAAASQQIQKEAPQFLKLLAQKAADASPNREIPDNVIRYLNAFGQDMANSEYSLAGIMGLMIMMDTDMNARLPDIFSNPEGYNYEALARRALENSRRFVADSRTLVGKTAVTIYEDLLKIPARDRSYKPFGDPNYADTIIDTAGLPTSSRHLVPAGSVEYSIQATFQNMMRDDIQTGKLRLDAQAFGEFMHDWISSFMASRTSPEITDLLMQMGVSPNDARFIIRNPEAHVSGSHPMTKPTLSTALDKKSIQQFSEHIASLLVNHVDEQRAAGALLHLLEGGTISLFPQHKGSAAGDFAKSVVRSLFEYERSKTALEDLSKVEKTIAEKEKGLPTFEEPGKSLSPSVPLIDDAGVAYKKTLFTNAILDSMNKGQRAVGMLDASWQYSRGGSMMGDGGNRLVIGLGPNRIPCVIKGGTTSTQIPALMSLAHGLFGDDIWAGLPVIDEMKTDTGLKATVAKMPWESRIKTARYGKRVFEELVAKIDAKVRQLGWSDSEIRILDNFTGHILNSDLTFSRISENWHLVEDDGKPSKTTKTANVDKAHKNAAVFMNEGHPVAVPSNLGGVPYGYTMNYGLQRAHARHMFPGASGKSIDLVSIDAFDRPFYDVTWDAETQTHTHRVILADKVIFETSIKSTEPQESASAKMLMVREKMLQNSKYRGSNPYVRGFLNDWSASGGYVDFGFASGVKSSEFQEANKSSHNFGDSGLHSTTPFERGQMVPIGASHGYPRIPGDAVQSEAVGLMQKGVMRNVQSGSMSASSGFVQQIKDDPHKAYVDMRGGAIDYTGGGRSTQSTSQIPAGMGDMASFMGSSEMLGLVAKAYGMTPGQFKYAHNFPVVISFVHTPTTRDAKQMKAYQERVSKGMPLMMITGSSKPDMTNPANLAQLAGYLRMPFFMRNPSYAPRKDRDE
jgi:hypothetical protein